MQYLYELVTLTLNEERTNIIHMDFEKKYLHHSIIPKTDERFILKNMWDSLHCSIFMISKPSPQIDSFSFHQNLIL